MYMHTYIYRMKLAQENADREASLGQQVKEYRREDQYLCIEIQQ